MKKGLVLFLILGTLILAACTEAGEPGADPSDSTASPGTAESSDGRSTDLPEFVYEDEPRLNEGFSRFPSGPQSGLWAGNVQTLPERPEALPDSFWEEPTEIRPYPAELDMGAESTLTFRDPERLPDPLWIFADELDKAELDAAVEEALSDERVVVVYGRDYSHMVGPVAPPHPFQEVPVEDFGLALAWAPWEERVPHVNTTYYVTPPELERTTRNAVYALMAFETVADEVEAEAGAQ